MTGKRKKKDSNKIEHAKIQIDPEIVSNRYRADSSQRFSYFAYHMDGKFEPDKKMDYSETPGSKRSVFHKSDVCFASLGRIFNLGKDLLVESKKYNRIYCKAEGPHSSTGSVWNPRLTEEEKREWISLSLEHKMLPPYVAIESLLNFILILDVSNITPQMLYIYLSTFRHVVEYTGFVRSVLYLVKKCNMHYYAAYILAGRITVSHAGHHTTNFSRLYGDNSSNTNDVLIPLKYIIGLNRLVSNSEKYKISGNSYSGYNFGCSKTIESISKLSNKCTPQELLNPHIIKAFLSETDGEAKKLIDKYDSERERYVYV